MGLPGLAAMKTVCDFGVPAARTKGSIRQSDPDPKPVKVNGKYFIDLNRFWVIPFVIYIPFIVPLP